jgi:hypothetical protein
VAARRSSGRDDLLGVGSDPTFPVVSRPNLMRTRQAQRAFERNRLPASITPAAHQRGAICPPRQRLTVFACFLRISVMESTALVLRKVRGQRGGQCTAARLGLVRATFTQTFSGTRMGVVELRATRPLGLGQPVRRHRWWAAGSCDRPFSLAG